MQAELRIRSQRQLEMLDITDRVRNFVGEAGIDEGLCSVYVAHATAAVLINENADPWQAIMIVELDGPEERRVILTLR